MDYGPTSGSGFSWEPTTSELTGAAGNNQITLDSGYILSLIHCNKFQLFLRIKDKLLSRLSFTIGWMTLNIICYISTDLEINQDPKSKHAMQYTVNTARERISLSDPVTAGLLASHLSGEISKESWCGAALGLLYGHPIIISLFLTPSSFSIDMIGISFL